MYPSQKAYNPRSFQSFWKPFVRVFQVLCVSHYSLFHSNKRIGRFLYFIGASGLHISLMIYILKFGPRVHFIADKNFKESPLMYYVSFMSVIANLVSHTVAHLEPLFTKKQEEEIYQRLNEINEIFATKLNYVTDFDVIRRKFIQKTVSLFVFASVLSFGYSLFYLPSDTFGICYFLLSRIISVLMIRGRRCQIAFHVNTLTNILRDLQLLLKWQQENYRTNSNGFALVWRENIRYIRDIYSNVWLIKNLLSSCFGWSFIALLVEFSFELINSSYWAYVNIKVYKSTHKIIRKQFIQWRFLYRSYRNIHT